MTPLENTEDYPSPRIVWDELKNIRKATHEANNAITILKEHTNSLNGVVNEIKEIVPSFIRHKTEFVIVRKIVFGLVSMILVSVAAALISMVIG